MNNNLYCMTDGIFSRHALIKRNLTKACFNRLHGCYTKCDNMEWLIVSEIRDVYMKDRIHNI